MHRVCEKRFPTLRHNLIRDIIADLLTEVCHSVSIEPTLQPPQVSSYSTELPTWKMELVLTNVHRDFRVTSFPSLYRRQENEKRRAYWQRILEVEHGSFTPLVFSATGSIGPAAMVMYTGDWQVSWQKTQRTIYILNGPRMDSLYSELCPSSNSHPVYLRCTLSLTQA